MERNSQQVLGELKKGDRFHLPGKDKTVWEVVADVILGAKEQIYINRPGLNGNYIDRHPSMKYRGTPVIFLRSTT